VRADRLLSIVLLLQTRRQQTAQQLATELGVSVRTIYRDMTALGAAGIPVYADPAGYQLVQGYRTQLTGLTPAEAQGLPLAGLPTAAADLGLAEAVAAAQLKVAAALPPNLRERATRMRQRFHLDAPGWYHDGDSSEHLATVADAVWQQRAITIRYDSWSGSVERRLEPYGLVLKAGKWYLVAKAATKTGTSDEDRIIRTFRVTQIRKLSVQPDTFERPEGFDLVAFWREYIVEFRSRLHRGEALVRVAPGALDRLVHAMGQAVAGGERQSDGWILARIPIESDRHAEGEFLRLGTDVEVLEPPALRERLAVTVAQLTARYANT
jgi:predicted DNA-binding transcriptional regulator YafY